MSQAEHVAQAVNAAQPENAERAAGRTSRTPLKLRIPPRAQEVGRARHWFRACLRTWQDEGAAVAEAVFAEVAANAVRHGRGKVTVTVQLSQAAVRCDIRDGGWRSPRLLAARQPELEHGRGMVIIAALADNWGVRRHLLGKTVWFEVLAPT